MWICYGFCHRLAFTNTATNRRWMCISEVPLCTCSALLLFISSWSLVGSCFKPLLRYRSSWTMYPKCCYIMFSFCCGGVCAPRISKISSQCERYYVKGLQHLIMQGFHIKMFVITILTIYSKQPVLLQMTKKDVLMQYNGWEGNMQISAQSMKIWQICLCGATTMVWMIEKDL